MKLSFKKLAKILLAFILLLATTLQLAYGAGFSEDQVKAVYLINFADFIRWPDNAFAENPNEFCFCALHGDTPLISSLKKVIVNESVKGRKLIFKQINNEQELKGCQVFYVHSNDQSRFIEFLPVIEQKSILTVSDDVDFIKNGGMITITRHRRRLRPTINVSNINKTELKASAKLLELAILVETD